LQRICEEQVQADPREQIRSLTREMERGIGHLIYCAEADVLAD